MNLLEAAGIKTGSDYLTLALLYHASARNASYGGRGSMHLVMNPLSLPSYLRLSVSPYNLSILRTIPVSPIPQLNEKSA